MELSWEQHEKHWCLLYLRHFKWPWGFACWSKETAWYIAPYCCTLKGSQRMHSSSNESNFCVMKDVADEITSISDNDMTHHAQSIRPPVSRWRRKLLRSSWRPRGFHKCFTSPYVTISFIGIISTSMEIINHIKLTMKIDSPSRPDGDSNPGPPHYECRS